MLLKDMKKNIVYPENKEFAFTIFDDTDVSTLENIRPIYDYLYSLGILTTKSVWPLRFNDGYSDFAGSHTLEDKEYAEYVKQLSARGFEIAFHGASMESSTRKRTIEAFKKFYDVLGFFPRSYATHAGNKENIYWGENRFQFIVFKQLYRLLYHKIKNYYSGDNQDSVYYWADICQKYINYARTFTFHNINLLNISKSLPYSIKSRPVFESFFFTADANNVEEFNELLCIKNQDKLEQERGVSIISTHFGKGFVKDNELHQKTNYLLQRLAKRNGWFVPVSTVLDFLKSRSSNNYIGNFSLFMLEFKWFLHAFKRKLKNREYEKTELAYLNIK